VILLAVRGEVSVFYRVQHPTTWHNPVRYVSVSAETVDNDRTELGRCLAEAILARPHEHHEVAPMFAEAVAACSARKEQ
jgi:hypothetical protein